MGALGLPLCGVQHRACVRGGGEFRLNWLLRGESVLYPLPSGEEPPNILPDPPQNSSLPFYEVLSLFGSPGGKKKDCVIQMN